MHLKLFLSAAACALLVAMPAQAAPLLFTVSGDYSATFQLDSNPTITAPLFGTFSVDGVAGTYGGAAGTADLFFYDDLNFGGFDIVFPTLRVFLAGPPQIFGGTYDAPTFAPDSFALTVQVGDGPLGRATLTITALDATVPEPATWLTMGAGFGLLGCALRRRARPVPA